MPSSACDWSSDVCSSDRSEEHTSELQSRSDLVCRLLLAEKNTSELQSRSDLVCRLLLEKKNYLLKWLLISTAIGLVAGVIALIFFQAILLSTDFILESLV